MRTKRLLLLLPLLGLAACQPAQKYYWGDYSSSLNNFYADPKAEPGYEKALFEVTSDGGPGKKVPPGLYAEYGYIQLSHGNVDKAIELFQREEQAWPESAVFMEKEIAAVRATQKPAASGGTEKSAHAAQPSS